MSALKAFFKSLYEPKTKYNWFINTRKLTYFITMVLFYELFIKIMNSDPDAKFFDASLIRIFLFSASFGFLLFVLIDLIPNEKVARWVGGFVSFFGFVFTGIEYCCRGFYGTYFSLGYILDMTGQVVTDFFGLIYDCVITRLPFLIILLLPFIEFCVFRKIIIPNRTKAPWNVRNIRIFSGIMTVLLFVVGHIISMCTADSNIYTYDFNSNWAVPKFGVAQSIRLELQYTIFGMPEMEVEVTDGPLFTEYTDPTVDIDVTTTEATAATSEIPEAVWATPTPSPSPTPTPYPYNVTDIDFESLYESSSNSSVQNLDLYLGNRAPTQQNDYTGMFEGKNLILITAEAFSPYVINEEFTPTLYRLSHNGFVFENYYQPNWHLSTTGGEFAVMTGIIPQWIGQSNSFTYSANNYMPYGLGNVFGEMGYSTLAYHNNLYSYYNRDRTHPNLGYDYTGVYGGLELPNVVWPNSDLELMEVTCDSYIQDYVENGTNFHAYYMTVSGHCNYSWGANAMSAKNRDEACEFFPDSSSQVQAYMACNLELEYGLEYLVNALEEAGIADETVIVLSADHYPYGLSNSGTDYYCELSGIDDNEQDITRYQNTLIMWCGDMEDEEPIYVDTPCSSIDIVPTLLNLFGIEYDSRLFSGRDIFAPNFEPCECSETMPLVILPMNSGYSWITDAGQYDATTGEFMPNPGCNVSDEYVDEVSELVSDRWRYAGYLIQYDYYNVMMPPEPEAEAEVNAETAET